MNREEKTKLHIWNLSALVDEFKQGKISDEQRVRYVIADMVLITFLLFTATQTVPYSIVPALISLALSVGLVIWGIRWCYAANQQGDEKDFLGRFIAVNFIVSIRLSVFFLLVAPLIFALIFTGLDQIAGIAPATFSVEYPIALLVVPALYVLFFWIIRKSINEISQVHN